MKKKLAFTLIEIMVAIIVFAVGILAVLRVLIWNLSILDQTNTKLQATVLAKEGLELLYNVRDSNLEKELPWNCVVNPDIYSWSVEKLTDEIGYAWSIQDVICQGVFGDEKNILQLSFDDKYYIIQNLVEKSDNFEQLFEKNQICEYLWWDMSWFAYCSDKDGWQTTFFARYLSFSPINISQDQTNTLSLPVEKILKVESHVLYKKWHKTGDIVYESFIWNY